METTKTNYEELEGKQISANVFGKTVSAKVTGCDYDIGVTIQDLDNNYLLCYIGPSSTLNKVQLKEEDHAIFFDYLANEIKSGKLDFPEILDTYKKLAGNTGCCGASAETCPFSQ